MADAPSFKISTLLIAASGMLLISTKAVEISLANGDTAMRRPLIKIKVESAPKPRNETLEPPFPVPSLPLP